MIANTYVSDAEYRNIVIFFVLYVISIPVALFIWEVYKEYRKQQRRKNHPSMQQRKAQR
jgi:nitric oxide reductase large subunit